MFQFVFIICYVLLIGALFASALIFFWQSIKRPMRIQQSPKQQTKQPLCIVVYSRNNADQLPTVLNILAEQLMQTDIVLVVDNNSQDNSTTLISYFRKQHYNAFTLYKRKTATKDEAIAHVIKKFRNKSAHCPYYCVYDASVEIDLQRLRSELSLIPPNVSLFAVSDVRPMLQPSIRSILQAFSAAEANILRTLLKRPIDALGDWPISVVSNEYYRQNEPQTMKITHHLPTLGRRAPNSDTAINNRDSYMIVRLCFGMLVLMGFYAGFEVVHASNTFPLLLVIALIGYWVLFVIVYAKNLNLSRRCIIFCCLPIVLCAEFIRAVQKSVQLRIRHYT